MRIGRRQHIGTRTEEPKPPPTIADVGIPQVPLPPNVAIINSDGTPTVEFYQWQMMLHEWRTNLFLHLGGTMASPPEETP